MKKLFLLVLVIGISSSLILFFKFDKPVNNEKLLSKSVRDISEKNLNKESNKKVPTNEDVFDDVESPILIEKNVTKLTEVPNQYETKIRQPVEIKIYDKKLLDKHHTSFEKSIVTYEENLLDIDAKKRLEVQLKNATEYRKMMLQFGKEQMEKTANNK